MRVLDVGNCSFDHQSIKQLLTRTFSNVEVHRAHSSIEAEQSIAAHPFDLILVNRKFDRDGSDGMAWIQALRRASPSIAVALISNYPEYQKQAQEWGAIPGFGKSEISDPSLPERLSQAVAQFQANQTTPKS